MGLAWNCKDASDVSMPTIDHFLYKAKCMYISNYVYTNIVVP